MNSSGSETHVLTKATSIIMVPTRIRFLITPLLSAWHCGPQIGFSSRWRRGGVGGGGGGTDAPRSMFSLFFGFHQIDSV